MASLPTCLQRNWYGRFFLYPCILQVTRWKYNKIMLSFIFLRMKAGFLRRVVVSEMLKYRLSEIAMNWSLGKQDSLFSQCFIVSALISSVITALLCRILLVQSYYIQINWIKRPKNVREKNPLCDCYVLWRLFWCHSLQQSFRGHAFRMWGPWWKV